MFRIYGAQGKKKEKEKGRNISQSTDGQTIEN